MLNPQEPVSSLSQDEFVCLAEQARGRLMEMATAQLKAWPPESVKWFIDACQACYWLELNARAFDRRVERANRCWGD